MTQLRVRILPFRITCQHLPAAFTPLELRDNQLSECKRRGGAGM